MDWELLERAPKKGDVLWHDNNLIVLVLRTKKLSHSSEVEVFWILRNEEAAGGRSVHNGEFSTWKGWRKA